MLFSPSIFLCRPQRPRRRRHTFGFTCGCDERRHLTVTAAAAADVDGAREILTVRCHHVTVSQPTGGNSPSIQGSLRPVSGSWAWRRGRLLPEGGRTGRDASAIRMGDTTYHAMAFAEGDIDNHGRFEPLAADMKPYGSGADIDAACAPVLPPDAYYTGRPRPTPMPSRCGTRAGAFRNRVAGVRRRRHRLELVGSVRRSGLRRRPRPVHGQRHGRRGVRVPTRRGAAVDRLASAKADKPAPNAVAERVEVLEASSSAFARSGRPHAMSGSKPRGRTVRCGRSYPQDHRGRPQTSRC